MVGGSLGGVVCGSLFCVGLQDSFDGVVLKGSLVAVVI
jgi:hypothetical protein